MKKNIHRFILIVVLLCPLFFNIKSYGFSGETLGDLLKNLDSLEQKYQSISEEKKLTEERLNTIKTEMINVGLRINEIENTMIAIQKEIYDLNLDIVRKKEQIRTLVNVFQKNNGDENFYLEFIFGAETLTDFIYRKQITEQMTKYNNEMIEKFKEQIKNVEEKSKELDLERQKLEEENKKLILEQEELGPKMNILDEDARDMLEEIADAKRVINNYQKMGCKETDLIENCSVIPADSAFLRPLTQGVVTSGYGTRENPVADGYQFHPAVDIGGNITGTSVYAAASGVVILAYTVPNQDIRGVSCGGNHVVIQHKIGNVYYASRYMHLHKVYVSPGDEVTSDSIIGAVGGGEIYDRCSTGPHLDFSIAKGIYGKDFYLFRQPYTVNPYTLVNLPEMGIYYTNRYQRF